MEKLIITVAQTGGFHGKDANPALPEQPDEIIQSAYDCYNAGAAIVHIHAREKDGSVSANYEIFREINEGIKAKCNLIIQDTTGGGPQLDFEGRINSLKAEPEMASLNMGMGLIIMGDNEIIMENSPAQIQRAAKIMKERGIKPEMEVYSLAMMGDVEELIRLDLVDKPYYVNFVLGMGSFMRGGLPYTPKILLHLVEHLPPDSIFNVTAISYNQLPASSMSMLLGGNVRVGMEDNIFYHKGVLAESNAQLVERAARMARELGREIATPDEAREILNIKKP
jgi:3-keto-5-aminohexanoate cleavage enzyme